MIQEIRYEDTVTCREASHFFAKIIPHIFFLILLGQILAPSLVEIDNPWVFLVVVVGIEIVMLIRFNSRTARDIVTFIYLILIVWEYSTTKIVNPNQMLLPVPERVFAVYYQDWELILQGIGSSFYLLGVGFLSAFMLGIILGMITGWFERPRKAVFPIAKVISPIPPIIYTPYAVALLPSFQLASIFVIFSSIFWYVFLNMIISVSTIDKKILDSAKTLNIGSLGMLRDILFPYCLPRILKSLPISLANAFMVLTAAEMIGASSGLGWFVKYYSDFADYTRVVAGIILIGVVVSLIGALVVKLEKLLVRWN